MSNVVSIAHAREYVLTYKGQLAKDTVATCWCSPVPKDGMLVCLYCGTAYRATRPAGVARTNPRKLS